MEQRFNENVVKEIKGIRLDEAHAFMIWKGNKSIIVSQYYYDGVIGKTFYVIGGNNAYSVIKLTNIEEVDVERFRNDVDKHRMSFCELSKMLKGKKVFYYYHFEKVEDFDHPVYVELKNSDGLIVDFEFSDVSDNKDIKFVDDFVNYDVDKVSDNKIKDDFRIVLSMYCDSIYNSNSRIGLKFIDKLFIDIINEINNNRNFCIDPSKLDYKAKVVYDSCVNNDKFSDRINSIYNDIRVRIDSSKIRKYNDVNSLKGGS